VKKAEKRRNCVSLVPVKHAVAESRFGSCELPPLSQENNEDGRAAHGSTVTVGIATPQTKRLHHCPFEAVSSVQAIGKSLRGGEKTKWLGKSANSCNFRPTQTEYPKLPMLILDGITFVAGRVGAFSPFLKKFQFSCLATDKYVMVI